MRGVEAWWWLGEAVDAGGKVWKLRALADERLEVVWIGE